MNRLPLEKRAQILRCLIEGNSIRGTGRLVDVSKNTVIKLLVDVGRACQWYQDVNLRHLTCQRVQVDEIWSFVGSKQKNVPAGKEGRYGDIWTWTSICADTKLVPTWVVGLRDAQYALAMMEDLADRIDGPFQLTTDGHTPYKETVAHAFNGREIDYAMLVKVYGDADVPGSSRQDCVGISKRVLLGSPDLDHVSTSYVERNNLTMRMGIRRFARRTNAFSKKVANHNYAVSLHFMHYNFVRQHQSLRVSPAMAAGVEDKLWAIEDVLEMTEHFETQVKGRAFNQRVKPVEKYQTFTTVNEPIFRGSYIRKRQFGRYKNVKPDENSN